MTMTDPRHSDRTTRAELRHLDSGLNILFLAALPMLLWIFQGSFSGMATGIAMIWTLSVALRLISTGQKIHRAYDAATSARPPRLPRKLLGSALLGFVALILAGHRFDALLLPVGCGVAAAILSLIAFRPDPMTRKGCPESAQPRDQTETLQVSALNDRLTAISDTLEPLSDADLLRRTEALRLTVTQHLTKAIGDEARFDRVLALADRIATMIEAEAPRLLAAQGHTDQTFARRRFVAKLETLFETFEDRARKLTGPARTDAFDEEAQRLLDRMPRESAA